MLCGILEGIYLLHNIHNAEFTIVRLCAKRINNDVELETIPFNITHIESHKVHHKKHYTPLADSMAYPLQL